MTKPACQCRHPHTDHYKGTGECFYAYNCGCKAYKRSPIKDDITRRPEEEPGYGL